MGQTPEGAKRAAATHKALYGPDYHQRIGKLGRAKSNGGFEKMTPEQHHNVSSLGGKAKAKKRQDEAA